LAQIGVKIAFDEVDGLLHHAEAHRTGSCYCVTERNGMGMTSAEKQRAFRERARLAGFCARGGKAHGKATHGAICAACLAYDQARQKKHRHEAKIA
jgi:hypothetical protein